MARQPAPSLSDSTGKLLLRLTLGVFMLFHGYAKITKGVSGIETSLANFGLPAWVAYGVYFGELLAPLLVIIGYYARAGGAIIVINMIFAITLSHSKQDRKSTRLNSSHVSESRMPSSA